MNKNRNIQKSHLKIIIYFLDTFLMQKTDNDQNVTKLNCSIPFESI